VFSNSRKENDLQILLKNLKMLLKKRRVLLLLSDELSLDKRDPRLTMRSLMKLENRWYLSDEPNIFQKKLSKKS